MHKNIKQNDYSRYAANRDVISLFSGAMGLEIGKSRFKCSNWTGF